MLCEIKKRSNTSCLASIFNKTELEKEHFIVGIWFTDRSNKKTAANRSLFLKIGT